MEHEATIKFVTNMDRPAIEAKLREIKKLADSKGLSQVAKLLSNTDGKGRGELEGLINQCIQSLKDSPEGKAVSPHLELVQINLPNLK